MSKRKTVNMTPDMLIELIKEVMNEAALCHDPNTGHFDDCESGNVYSLSHRAARDNSIDKRFIGRGKVTKNRKLKTPFGMNTSQTKQCGRQTIQGDKKKKDKRCHDYPKGKYFEVDHPLVPSSDDSEAERLAKTFPGAKELRRLQHGIYEDEGTGDVFVSLNDLEAVLAQLRNHQSEVDIELIEGNQVLAKKCRQVGFVTRQEAFKAMIVSLNQVKVAMDGKLFEPKK